MSQALCHSPHMMAKAVLGLWTPRIVGQRLHNLPTKQWPSGLQPCLVVLIICGRRASETTFDATPHILLVLLGIEHPGVTAGQCSCDANCSSAGRVTVSCGALLVSVLWYCHRWCRQMLYHHPWHSGTPCAVVPKSPPRHRGRLFWGINICLPFLAKQGLRMGIWVKNMNTRHY